ncbi:TonB-dependent receptor domain-containing protein [Eudoraea chungangensis]|uniref:TonB-dependent receptor domain-containing protein n=1 Tax=Eudoraea chungangensis TaxID=1481905 RepID=UPI0023ED324C|nr:TonB-dependent receptor [Eudoraea chungangensis]
MSFRKLLFFFLLLLVCQGLLAQESKEHTVSGKVVEANSGTEIAFATVLIADTDTKQPITGTTTLEDGSFELSFNASNFYIEVSFIGYQSKTFDTVDTSLQSINLGVIVLVEDAEQLDEVIVQGEVSKMEFKLDKRVFNVGKDISSTGMGALEVLNNVPSVNVSIEGEVSLRGSAGVQILIDGKPSVLADDPSNALGTVTADMIESVEVITNPSAKYDAEGTTGIINIILKKEEKTGLNGSVSINTGAPDNHSLGFSLNRRTEKFNLFTQIGAGYRSLPRDSEATNQDLINNITTSSVGTSFRNETFNNITLGSDYYLDDFNVITLSGNFAYEIEDQPSETFFSLTDNNTGENTQWSRVEVTDANNPKWQYELNYKKEFRNNEDHTLGFSAIGSFFGKDQSSEFNNTEIIGTDIPPDQQTTTEFQQANYTFKLDYANPLSEKYEIGAGAQYLISDVGNDFSVSDLENGIWVPNDDLTNNFDFNQDVLAFYGSGSYEADKWGIKAGLRIELTSLNTLLENTNESNDRNYSDFFPSLHTTYKLTEKVSFQAGYSKRIYRPRLWDLNPFFNIRDNFNIRTGNPNLLPEYTDSFELTSIYSVGKVSLNSSLYYRLTTDAIERVSTFEDNVRVTMPMNIGTDQVTGIEFNGKYVPINWLTLNGDFNFGYFIRKGSFEDQVFDFDGERWTARLNSKWSLPADIDLELTGNYRSGYLVVQGEVSETAFMDVGIRKKFIKGKAVVNLSVRDVFSSRIFETAIAQNNFTSVNYNQRGRFITMGISYGFGKGQAMTYSGGRRR